MKVTVRSLIDMLFINEETAKKILNVINGNYDIMNSLSVRENIRDDGPADREFSLLLVISELLGNRSSGVSESMPYHILIDDGDEDEHRTTLVYNSDPDNWDNDRGFNLENIYHHYNQDNYYIDYPEYRL